MAGIEDVFGQKDDDSDLYDDIIVSNVDLKYATEKKQHNEDLERENNELKLRVQTLEQEVVSTKKVNLTLRRNISLLYQTAKVEIAAKNNLLKDLQTRYDGLVFRRLNRAGNNADIYFPKNAESPTQVQYTAVTASCSTNSRFSPSSSSKQTETYSRHHSRSRQIHQESSSGFGVKICDAVQSPGSTAHVSNTKCGNNVSSSINNELKDSDTSGRNNLLDNEKAKEQLDVKLNGDVLNSISIDFLKEVTKLCEASSPQNSKKPSSSSKRMTDAERVLAHHKRTAKVSVDQNAVTRFPQQARSTFVNDRCKKYDAEYQMQSSKNAIIHHRAFNHKRQKKEMPHRPIRNCESNRSSRRNLFEEGNFDKNNVSDVDRLKLKTNAENSDVLQVNNSVVQNVEVRDTTSVKKRCTDENHSFEQELPNDRLTDNKPGYLDANCETKSHKPRNETVNLGTDGGSTNNKQNSDLDKRNEKRNWSSTAKKANNERCSVESSFLPPSNDGTANRSLSKDKEKSLTKQAESKQNEGSYHKMSHSRAKRDERTSHNHTKPLLSSSDVSSRKQSMRSDERKRSSDLPRRNSCNVKRRYDDPDKNNLPSHQHNRRDRCERSRSSLISDKTTRNSGERENKISSTSNSGKRESSLMKSDKTTRNSDERENKTSSTSNLGKLQSKSNHSCNGQMTKSVRSPVRRSHDSHRTRDACLQASSKKRKFVELDILAKNANDSKKARLKRSPHKSTNNGTISTDKYSPCKSDVLHHKIAESSPINNNLEEGELPD